MKIQTWTVESVLADEVVDLTFNQNSEFGIAADVFNIADFDIEVVGNDAIVTVTAKGAFPGSGYADLTNGTFPVDGGKSRLEGFSVGEFTFSRTGTTAYTINIIRRIID